MWHYINESLQWAAIVLIVSLLVIFIKGVYKLIKLIKE